MGNIMIVAAGKIMLRGEALMKLLPSLPPLHVVGYILYSRVFLDPRLTATDLDPGTLRSLE